MTLVHRETNTLALAAQAVQLLDFGTMLIKSGMLPQSIRTPESAVAVMVKGMELGLPAMAALNGITVIQGKPTVSPQLMLSLINRSGQLENIDIDTGKDGATVTMKRRGRTPFTAKFGPVEAQAMGLNTKDNYKKQPAVMYQWRAVAACARVVFPDVIDGLYTPEELGADVSLDENGAMTVSVQQEKATAVDEAFTAVADLHKQNQDADKVIMQWGQKTDDLVARITAKYGEDHGVALQAIYDRVRWHESPAQARQCYDEVKAYGLTLAQPAPAQEVGSDTMASAEQIRALQAIARTAGATTSEQRAVLWGHMVNHTGPLHTKELAADQAQFLLDTCEGLDVDGRKQTYAEAQKVAQGRLV